MLLEKFENTKPVNNSYEEYDLLWRLFIILFLKQQLNS